MEKQFRVVGQTPREERIMRPLHEFLEEQQEPFLLEDYLLDRQYSRKRIHAYPNGNLSNECSQGVPELGVNQKKPSLPNADSFQDNRAEHSPWPFGCCFLEMNQRHKKKRRRVSGGKARSDSFHILGYAEEYHVEELSVNVKRLKFTFGERKETEMMQVDSIESEFASIPESEGSLCTKLFSFRKEKNMEKAEKSKGSDADKIVKCSLFKSILRKLASTKDLLPNIHTDLESISKRFFNPKRKLILAPSKDESCRDDQVQVRLGDIVSWNNFREAPYGVSDLSGDVGKICVSSEPAKTYADLVHNDGDDEFSANGPGDPLQPSDRISEKMEVGSQDKNVQLLQPFVCKSNSQSLDLFSTSTINTSSLFDSSDSDMGSISVDKLSSNNSFEESVRKNWGPPQGIDPCVLEVTSSSGYLSLDSDEYRVKDCQIGLSHGVDQLICGIMNDCHEELHSSNNPLQEDGIHPPTSTLKRSIDLKTAGHKENLLTFSGCVRDDDLRFGEMKLTSHEDEGENNVWSANGHRQKKGDVHFQGENLDYASDYGCSLESKQLSPNSVLEVPSEEETSASGPTDAGIQATELWLYKRLKECSHHSWKDALISQQKARGEDQDPSQSENKNFCVWNREDTDNSKIANLGQISCEPSPFQCLEEMDWERGGTEEYVRKVINLSETISCPMDLNDREIQGPTCLCPPSHADDTLPSQCMKRNGIPIQARQLLFDCVNEILESLRKQYGGGVLEESRSKECSVSEHLVGAICNQIYSWMETHTDAAEKMIELAWKKEGEDWTKFRDEIEEIGTEIEVDILKLLIEELVDDLAHLQP